jgi:hypothetical protein
MFFVELNTNIPYESAEQPMLTKDYSLLKRRLRLVSFLYIKDLFVLSDLVCFNVFVALQQLD